MSEKIQKKLAAIMFTYLVEYDEYLKNDEEYATKVLNESKKILKNNIQKYNGSIIKYLDNMSFMQFSSATDAYNTVVGYKSGEAVSSINCARNECFCEGEGGAPARSRSSEGVTSSGLAPRTTKSASLPGSMEPTRPSS